jgi:hypothetical protein
MNEIIPDKAINRWCVMPLFIPSALLIASFLGCIFQQPAAQPMRIEATLDRPITNVKGFTWPVDEGELQDDFVCQEPCEVKVVFPSGRVWETKSRFTVVSQKEKMVRGMIVSPDDRAMQYARCVARVEEILGELGVGPSTPAFQMVEGWKSLPQGEQVGTCAIEDGIKLFVQIKSAIYEDPTEPPKWFVSCEFSVSRLYMH